MAASGAVVGTGVFLTASGLSLSIDSIPGRDRYPLWDRRVSGFHGDDWLIARMEMEPGRFIQTRLVGRPSRLWCLCAGVMSEREICERLSAEESIALRESIGETRDFFRAMYRDGYLIPSGKDGATYRQAVEMNLPPGLSTMPGFAAGGSIIDE